MTLPFFYIENLEPAAKNIVLEETASRHIVQVLRMNEGEKINLTDGKGNLFTTEITEAHKKHCKVKIIDSNFIPQNSKRICIAISLIKNSNRFEWFLEKATEIGVAEIIPLICERTEKEKFRIERMQGICISAMLQSQQTWLPVLHEPNQFVHLVNSRFTDTKKFIAHCMDGEKAPLTIQPINQSTLICIGPEGDFTKEEIELSLKNNFTPVSLGETRLRTETAGVVAAALLCHI